MNPSPVFPGRSQMRWSRRDEIVRVNKVLHAVQCLRENRTIPHIYAKGTHELRYVFYEPIGLIQFCLNGLEFFVYVDHVRGCLLQLVENGFRIVPDHQDEHLQARGQD